MSEDRQNDQPPWKLSYYLRPGYLLPCIMNKKTIEEEVKHMTIRDDDVFINAYIKSGNHWICTIVEAILNENPENAVIHSKARNIELGPIDHPDLFEVGLTKNNRPFSGAHIMENMPLTEQRVMRSHLRPEFMPDMLFETKPKTILLTRNPKDVAVSLFNFHHNNSTLAPVEWDDFIREFCNENTEYGSYFQYVIDWDAYSDEPWVLAVRFEDIKKSSQEHIEKIADFLGKSLTNEQLKEVARVTDFQFMKSHFGYPEAWQMRQGTRLQRKGTVGDWKNVFTVSQNEAFDSIYDKKMEGYEHLKYNFLDDY